MWQGILVKPMAADQPNMGDEKFSDHFEFEMQNSFGSILCKNLVQTKIGLFSIGFGSMNIALKYLYYIYINLNFQF